MSVNEIAHDGECDQETIWEGLETSKGNDRYICVSAVMMIFFFAGGFFVDYIDMYFERATGVQMQSVWTG